MVYAMFSIGILGFLVWSQLVALPYCEIEVTNLAICWNSLVLTNTFYSKNFVSYTQSAGNLNTLSLKSSSETTREISRNFDMFNKHLILRQQPYKNKISNTWLTWFIGFSEGDGALLTHQGRVKFVLTQKESAILYHIQKVLGFGTVREFESFSRFTVTKLEHILLLFFIFNGNLVLSSRQTQLKNWVSVLNKNVNIKLDTTLIKPNLSDSWLSGFTDAEGCFNINIQSKLKTVTGYRVVLRFLLDQKNAKPDLLHIRNLFGFGQVNLRKETENVYRYSNNSFKGLLSVHDYFLSFPLKTKKNKSFQNWLEVYNMVLNKEHLIPEGLKKIKILAKQVNLNNSLNNKTGSANK